MSKFKSTKVFDGFSTVFRQWKAENTHCRFVHGYGVSFKIWFEGELDERNWVWDFGSAKRSKYKIDGMSPKEWMSFMFDHTLIIAEDDPYLKAFQQMDEAGVAQVRVIPAAGCEKFAEYIYNKLNPWVQNDSQGRVRVTKVKFMEHGKNAAYYSE
jgi:6-pyruvoyltetrahydropterin/6-carboxytetrahydropterin synthase